MSSKEETKRGTILEGYSYRVSARFGSRLQIVVKDGTVSITGPRVPVVLYGLWVTIQAILLVSAVLALAASVVLWDWRTLLLALVLLAVHGMVGGFGAGCMWEMMNLIAFGQGTLGETALFSLSTVKRVKIGPGWARRGMWLLILPYIAGINQMSKGFCVSFEAPDGVTGRDVVYALHMRSIEDAQNLARLLGGK